MRCRRDSGDELMKLLVRKGINLILPPSDHMEAGTLILADADNSIRPASWKDVFGQKIHPIAKSDTGFSPLMFEAASVLNSEAGASLLGSILHTFGLASGAFKGAFGASKAAKIELSLIAPANKTLDNFDEMLTQLNDAAAEPTDAYQEKRFFVAIKVWRARGLLLRILDKSDKQVDFSASTLEDLKLATKLSIDKEDQGTYSFTAENAQVFGLTLRELVPLMNSNSQIVIGDRPSTEHMTMKSDENSEAIFHAFIGDDAFLDLTS